MLIYGLTFAYEVSHRYADMAPFFERLLQLEPESTHYGVEAKYYQFLADGSLGSFRAFEEAVKTVQRTDKCDIRAVQNREMVVAMFDNEFEAYSKAWQGKWDRHHRGHGNWSCPAQINDEANQAFLLLEDPIALVSMETVCANPWLYPNLLRDRRFVEEVRRDGRFVDFLKHFRLIPAA